MSSAGGHVSRTELSQARKAVLELEHNAFREEALERLRIQEALAQACFRALVLVNGGAIIALFTLIGSNAEIAKSAPSPSLWLAFAAFSFGLTTTIAAIIAGYFMQVKYALVTTYQMWNKECEIAGNPQVHDFTGTYKWVFGGSG